MRSVGACLKESKTQNSQVWSLTPVTLALRSWRQDFFFLDQVSRTTGPGTFSVGQAVLELRDLPVFALCATTACLVFFVCFFCLFVCFPFPLSLPCVVGSRIRLDFCRVSLQAGHETARSPVLF